MIVRVVKEEEKSSLFNCLQKYLYEMSQYYGDTMDDTGNFCYKYFPLYFQENERAAYFFEEGDERIGFALINAHSFTDEKIENCIAEFTIFPAYRQGGKGLKAIAALKEMRKGKWQLKYSKENRSGMKFWQKVKERYNGIEQPLDGSEIVITFE